VIEGREPVAPRGQAADLGAIRRSDAVIEMLAGGRRLRSRALRDPAVAVLSSLVNDVEAARSRPAGARSQGTTTAAAAVAAAAAVLAAAGLLVIAMLTRLSGARRWERFRR
jgi:hypothetical protein